MILSFLERTGHATALFLNSIKELKNGFGQTRRILDQVFQIGYQTFFIASMMNFCVGAVLAIQIAYSFQFSGAQELIGRACGIALAREIGPLITAFVIAGRVSSSITAELASMVVYQEVDALKTMRISPIRVLVMPRLVAIFLAMPFLALGGIIIGWIGGAVACQLSGFITITAQQYWADLKAITQLKDLANGMLKAQIFGLFSVIIACNHGLLTRGGPREIGISVTKSVVSAMFTILIIDYLLTYFLS